MSRCAYVRVARAVLDPALAALKRAGCQVIGSAPSPYRDGEVRILVVSERLRDLAPRERTPDVVAILRQERPRAPAELVEFRECAS